MRVTFIYPGIGICGFNGPTQIADYAGEACWISHGIASVATAISEHCEVDLIDLRELSDWEVFRKQLEVADAEYFAVSISSLNKKPALESINVIKEIYPQSKIVVGGFDPSMYPEQYKDVANYVIIGDGEYKLAEILGIKLNGKLPWIKRHLFNYEKELNCTFTPNMKPPMITMLAGRGCPYNCSYCQPAERSVHGHYRIREVDDVLGELRDLKEKYNYNSVLFWDDTFAISPSWVDRFCEGFKELDAQLVINCRADIICDNKPMFEKLKSVGLEMVLVGVETGSPRLLKLINKGVSVRQINVAFNICRELGIKTFATFMLGLPTETRIEAMSTMTLINQIGPSFGLPFYYTPIPGTDLYDFCVEKNLLLNGSGTIERTGKFSRSIKDIDYDMLDRYIANIRSIPKFVGT